jgi:hypothetical protein
MSGRRWLALILGVVVIAVAATLYWLPELVRHVATSRIHALTQRPVVIDRVDLNIVTGRFTVRGFRLAERDGHTPFAHFERLDVRVHLPSLIAGHLHVREMRLMDSTVRVVRLPTNQFNISDLLEGSGTTGRALDVTVDRFVLTGGTVTLEDQALPERRTWRSEDIAIDARNVSTRRDDGTAVARSVTAGAPVSLEIRNLRLRPVHLQAILTVANLDLTPARVYLPPDAPVTIGRGRASTSLTVALDARDGLRVDGNGQLAELALVRRDAGDPVAFVPSLSMSVSGFGLRDGELALAQLGVAGTVRVRDPRARPGAKFQVSNVRANVADLTWPATTPGRLDLLSSIPGEGTLAVTGTIRPPPANTELRMRLAKVDLATWAQFLPVAARVTGVTEADLRMNEPFATGIPARVQGSIAVNQLAVADARNELIGARRVEASGLTLYWPTRVLLDRVLVTAPRVIVERDRAGAFPLKDVLATTAPATPSAKGAGSHAIDVEISEIRVRNGAMAWRDQSVSPPVRLDIASIDARVTGVGWPLRGPAAVRVALRPPGGGYAQVTGRVGLDPISADVRLTAKNAELAPYQPYVPTTARFGGAADLDVAVVVPTLETRRATVRGSAAVSRVDVRDRERTVMQVERATATGVDVAWPERISVGRLALAQPWFVIERDENRALPLRTLLTPTRPAASATAVTSSDGQAAASGTVPAITVGALTVDAGGVRIVDRAVSPAFAVDFQPATLRVNGLSTAPAKPARMNLTGRLGPGAELTARGLVGSLGGPLHLDIQAELREFAVPRANPYLLQQAGWKTTEGRLTSKVQCRVEGDALSARTDIRLNRLQLVRAARSDGAQARIGLPLGMLTALMKDKRGNIDISFPVGGRLGDPRFDFSEAIWNAIRTVAVRAITLPVSWIGRMQFSPDSRIERIEVDPIPFGTGTSTLTAAGQTQAIRLAAFLDELPDVKLALTPVVSAEDLAAMKRRTLQATIERVAREGRLSNDEAVLRQFEHTFPGRPVPGSADAMFAALLEREPIPTTEIPQLAARRVEAVKGQVKQAGIDPGRMVERKPVQRDAESRIELEVLEPDAPRPSRLREGLRRLGVPLKGSGTED